MVYVVCMDLVFDMILTFEMVFTYNMVFAFDMVRVFAFDIFYEVILAVNMVYNIIYFGTKLVPFPNKDIRSCEIASIELKCIKK